jgi:hypothetical protein
MVLGLSVFYSIPWASSPRCLRLKSAPFGLRFIFCSRDRCSRGSSIRTGLATTPRPSPPPRRSATACSCASLAPASGARGGYVVVVLRSPPP